MDPFGQGPVAPSATPNSILQILGGLSARDPSAANPATTAAMAKSRDAITRILERQLARQEAPFTGLNDVATAATAALASGGRTPFGMTLEQLDQNRARNTANIAGTLSNVASREQRGGVDPIRAASLVMRHIEQQSRNGDRDAREVDSFVKSLASNMEPASALRFQTSYGQAIAEHVQKTGANPDPRELKMLIADFAQRGGFQTKLPNMQLHTGPFGEQTGWNPSPYGGGGKFPLTNALPPGGRTTPLPDNLPPVGTPLPGENSGPRLAQNAPGAEYRAQTPPPAQAAPPPATNYGPTTASQTGQQSVDRRKADVEFQAFYGLAADLDAKIAQAGATAMGPMGWAGRFVGAMTEQVRGLLANSEEARKQLPQVLQDVAYNEFLDGIIGTGADAAAIKAGVLTFAYRYSKAADPTGPVNKAELEHALNVMGEVWGSPTQVRRVMKTLVADAERKRNLILGVAPAAPQGMSKATRYGTLDTDPRAMKIRDDMAAGRISYEQARKLIEGLD